MHTNEGRIDGGDMKNHMVELDAALSAFVADLGPALANVTVVTLTEFGRTVRENGAVGTDHGHAFPMLVLGGGIKGGQVYGAWPGLDDKSLFINGSLAARTDYRDVLGEVLAKRGKVGLVHEDLPGPQAEDARAGRRPVKAGDLCRTPSAAEVAHRPRRRCADRLTRVTTSETTAGTHPSSRLRSSTPSSPRTCRRSATGRRCTRRAPSPPAPTSPASRRRRPATCTSAASTRR